MVGGRIAKRYAKALVELGRGAHKEAALARDIGRFGELFAANEELQAVLTSPTVELSNREAILQAILDRLGGIEPLARNFLRLMLRNRRIAHVKAVHEAFVAMLDESAGRVRASVTSAIPMDEASRTQLKKSLEKLFGKTVAVEHRVDPGLIGGVVTQVGHVVYDGSLRSQFERIREHLVAEK